MSGAPCYGPDVIERGFRERRHPPSSPAPPLCAPERDWDGDIMQATLGVVWGTRLSAVGARLGGLIVYHADFASPYPCLPSWPGENTM